MPPEMPRPTQIRIGADYQAVGIPDPCKAHQPTDRDDVLVNAGLFSIVDIFTEQALAANAWRRRMHERYTLGQRDAGYVEEDALHSQYPTRPDTGARDGFDPCDDKRMDDELIALDSWRALAHQVRSPCVA